MFINVYKRLYKFGLGDTNVWTLDSIIFHVSGRKLFKFAHCMLGYVWETFGVTRGYTEFLYWYVASDFLYFSVMRNHVRMELCHVMLVNPMSKHFCSRSPCQWDRRSTKMDATQQSNIKNLVFTPHILLRVTAMSNCPNQTPLIHCYQY